MQLFEALLNILDQLYLKMRVASFIYLGIGIPFYKSYLFISQILYIVHEKLFDLRCYNKRYAEIGLCKEQIFFALFGRITSDEISHLLSLSAWIDSSQLFVL